MVQIKIFSSNTIYGVENKVNDFLNTEDIEVIDIKQSECITGEEPYYSFTLTVIYKVIEE